MTSWHQWGKSILAEIISIQSGWKKKLDVLISFKMCFSAWSSGCGRSRCAPHAVSMCPCWSPSTGLHPAPKSHNSPASTPAISACSCDPPPDLHHTSVLHREAPRRFTDEGHFRSSRTEYFLRVKVPSIKERNWSHSYFEYDIRMVLSSCPSFVQNVSGDVKSTF